MTIPLSLDEVEERLSEAKSHVAGCDCDIELLETAMAALKVVEAAKSCGHLPRKFGSESCCDMCDALTPFRAEEK